MKKNSIPDWVTGGKTTSQQLMILVEKEACRLIGSWGLRWKESRTLVTGSWHEGTLGMNIKVMLVLSALCPAILPLTVHDWLMFAPGWGTTANRLEMGAPHPPSFFRQMVDRSPWVFCSACNVGIYILGLWVYINTFSEQILLFPVKFCIALENSSIEVLVLCQVF